MPTVCHWPGVESEHSSIRCIQSFTWKYCSGICLTKHDICWIWLWSTQLGVSVECRWCLFKYASVSYYAYTAFWRGTILTVPSKCVHGSFCVTWAQTSRPHWSILAPICNGSNFPVPRRGDLDCLAASIPLWSFVRSIGRAFNVCKRSCTYASMYWSVAGHRFWQFCQNWCRKCFSVSLYFWGRQHRRNSNCRKVNVEN